MRGRPSRGIWEDRRTVRVNISMSCCGSPKGSYKCRTNRANTLPRCILRLTGAVCMPNSQRSTTAESDRIALGTANDANFGCNVARVRDK